jgi:hypothetical protein
MRRFAAAPYQINRDPEDSLKVGAADFARLSGGERVAAALRYPADATEKVAQAPDERERKMAESNRSAKSTTTKGAKKGELGKASKGFTAEERAAMKEYLQEKAGQGEGESVVLAKIAAMPEPDRAMAKRLHAIVKASAPALSPRLWYGMPAYARDGKVVCFFQSAAKFKTRYATFGFSDKANLDEGGTWPTAFALKELTAADEAKIGALVKKAVS